MMTNKTGSNPDRVAASLKNRKRKNQGYTTSILDHLLSNQYQNSKNHLITNNIVVIDNFQVAAAANAVAAAANTAAAFTVD